MFSQRLELFAVRDNETLVILDFLPTCQNLAFQKIILGRLAYY